MSAELAPTKASVAIELSLLPKAARDNLNFWRAQLEPILALPIRGRTAHFEAIAKKTETPYGTVRRKFYALENHGVLGLVERRLAGPRWWKQAADSVTLPAEDQALLKLYCERNDRSVRAACKQMRADWRKGKITTAQPVDPRTGYPAGWSTQNLGRYAPSKFELTAARKGSAPAAAHRRLVYTTRKGLWVMSHVMFDDMWHNCFVNSFAEKQAGRPLELFSHDLFSARKVRWGIRPRTEREDGTMRGLTGRMTRYIIAATFYLDGYSPRGTVAVGEHGTATWTDSVARALHEHSGGLITSEFSGMQGARVHAGQYPGIRRGNPRMKASLESSNNLVQNVFGALPGQTGKDFKTDRPEHLPALLEDNDRWLALYDRLSPSNQKRLQFLLLDVNEFMEIASDLYAQIENDPEHELEGWVECGHVAQELLLAGQWIPQERLLGATEQEQALALSLISSGQLQTRPRRLTRREVWDRGAADLRKLNGAGMVAILGEDLARPNPEVVRKGMIEFEDAEVGPGVHRYEAVIYDPFGQRTRLPEGERYQVFVNPFALDWLFVCDSRGAYLGESRRIVDPCRGDIEAVRRTMGAVAADEAERLHSLRLRHTGEAVAKRDREENNTTLESDLQPESDSPSAPSPSYPKRRDLSAAAAIARNLMQDAD